MSRRLGRPLTIAAIFFCFSFLETPSTVRYSSAALAAAGRLEDMGMKDVAERSGVALGTIYRYFSSKDHVAAAALLEWARAYREDPSGLRSLAIVFEGPVDLREDEFEAAMWQRLQSLADKDEWRGQPYDHSVSADPGDPHFSLSFGGAAFFVVGLHPHASRPARRFPRPTLVFNLHEQFERLREEGRYERMREKIIERYGLTVEFKDWWFNVRKSNTEPLLRLNLEANSPQLLEQKFAELKKVLGEPAHGH